MLVKILKYLGLQNKGVSPYRMTRGDCKDNFVVPHEVRLIDCISIKYKKILVTEKELANIQENEDTICQVIGNLPLDNSEFETIKLEIHLHEWDKIDTAIYCIDSEIYIMNDNGNTIEAIRC